MLNSNTTTEYNTKKRKLGTKPTIYSDTESMSLKYLQLCQNVNSMRIIVVRAMFLSKSQTIIL